MKKYVRSSSQTRQCKCIYTFGCNAEYVFSYVRYQNSEVRISLSELDRLHLGCFEETDKMVVKLKLWVDGINFWEKNDQKLKQY